MVKYQTRDTNSLGFIYLFFIFIFFVKFEKVPIYHNELDQMGWKERRHFYVLKGRAKKMPIYNH